MAQRKDEQDRGVDGTNSRRAAAWLAWSLVALSVALLVGGLVLSRAASSAVPDLSFGETDDASVVANLITLLPFSVMGAIIASRHPRNAIGWLFCSVGVTVGLNSFAGDYTEFWLASSFGMSSLGDARAHAGSRGGRRAGAREACGFPAGLPRGHHPPLDHGDYGRARSSGRVARAQAYESPENRSPPPGRDRYGRRPPAPEDALPLHHLHAPVGFPGLRDKGSETLPELPPGDESRGEGVDPGGRYRARCALRDARRSQRGAGTPHGRRRRTVLPLQGAGQPEVGQDLSAHRRALVQALATRWRPRGYLRVRRWRALHGRHKPRRILADRLRDQERRVSGRARRRSHSVPEVSRRHDPGSR